MSRAAVAAALAAAAPTAAAAVPAAEPATAAPTALARIWKNTCDASILDLSIQNIGNFEGIPA